MQAVATKLDLPDDLVGYFSLFLIREGVDGGLTCKSQHQLLGMKTSRIHILKEFSIMSHLYDSLLVNKNG